MDGCTDGTGKCIRYGEHPVFRESVCMDCLRVILDEVARMKDRHSRLVEAKAACARCGAPCTEEEILDDGMCGSCSYWEHEVGDDEEFYKNHCRSCGTECSNLTDGRCRKCEWWKSEVEKAEERYRKAYGEENCADEVWRRVGNAEE